MKKARLINKKKSGRGTSSISLRERDKKYNKPFRQENRGPSLK
jgi:hypothetical protein